MPRSPATTNVLQAPGNLLLPLITGQLYAVWMMLTGRLSYLDYQLLSLAETWFVHLSLLVFNTRLAFGERLRLFAINTLVVLPALFLFIALLVALVLTPDDARMPWTIVADAAARMLDERLIESLGYLLATFGISALQAMLDPDPGRWWYLRVFTHYQVTIAATLVALFVLAPILIARQQIAWVHDLSPQTINLCLLILLALLRLAFSLLRHVQLLRRGADPYAEFLPQKR